MINHSNRTDCKLSVWQITHSANPNAKVSWQSLVESMQAAHSVEFAIRQTESLSILDLYLADDVLESILSKWIQPSEWDFLLWPRSQQKPQLLVFDMDSTFIEIEVIDELAHRHGVGDSVAKVTEAAMRGELDFSESLVSRVACLKGLSESVIDSICQQLPLSQGVDKLVSQCRQANVNVAIVSGGFSPFVNYLKDKMGLFKVKANHLQVRDNLLTGQLDGEIVDAQAKAVFVNSLAQELNLSLDQVMTIGDGANDLEMMKVSGFSLAYRAKPAVQQQAAGRMNESYLNHLAEVFEW